MQCADNPYQASTGGEGGGGIERDLLVSRREAGLLLSRWEDCTESGKIRQSAYIFPEILGKNKNKNNNTKLPCFRCKLLMKIIKNLCTKYRRRSKKIVYRMYNITSLTAHSLVIMKPTLNTELMYAMQAN